MHCGPVYPTAPAEQQVGGYGYPGGHWYHGGYGYPGGYWCHGGYGNWFALIAVLFILLIIIGCGCRTT